MKCKLLLLTKRCVKPTKDYVRNKNVPFAATPRSRVEMSLLARQHDTLQAGGYERLFNFLAFSGSFHIQLPYLPISERMYLRQSQMDLSFIIYVDFQSFD